MEDCWTCERKHQLPKHIAGYLKNTSQFEKGLLGRSFQSQVTRMKEYPPRYFLGGLVNPQPVCDEDSAALRVYALLPFTTSVQLSLKARVRGGLTVGQNDLLKFRDGYVAIVKLCAESLPSHRICAIVQEYTFVGKIDSAAILEQTRNIRTIELLNIECCMVWRRNSEHCIEALGYS